MAREATGTLNAVRTAWDVGNDAAKTGSAPVFFATG